jgi:hypothetical protein
MSDFERPKRYVPGPGEPALPPQLAQLTEKSTEEVMTELNRLPFFMTQLDNTDGGGGSNLELEALQALAYDGEADEVAENFKKQGNAQYKLKLYKNAIEFYNKGIAVKCDVAELNASLYLNRAACNLELKNYRRCINDAQESLKFDPKNIKAYFRIAKAFFALEKFEEAKQSLEFSFNFDPNNQAASALLQQIIKREDDLKKIQERRENERKLKEQKANNLKLALNARNYTNIKSEIPVEMLQDAKFSLEDELDVESQLIFPAMIIYPTTDEFDFVADISELSTPLEIIDIILQRPAEWFEDPKHQNFTSKNLDAFMETEAGGLIKVGKKATFNKALSTASPKIPLFDNALKLYLVPKGDAADWLSKWDKEITLKKRKEAGAA